MKIKPENIEPITVGRGLTFRRNLLKVDDETYKISDELSEGMLVLVSGMVEGTDHKIPMILLPDGHAEIALAFEVQDESGEWHIIDITKLTQTEE